MHVGFVSDPIHRNTVKQLMGSIRRFTIPSTGVAVTEGWTDSRDGFLKLLENATHLILMPHGDQFPQWMVYVFGFAAGRRIPVGVVTSAPLSGVFSEATDLTVDAVEHYLMTERASWEHAHRIDLARTRLRGTGHDSTAACDAAARGDDSLVDDFLTVGMSPDARNNHGVPLLVAAVRSRTASIVQRLLIAGADPNAACGSGGESALCEASSMGFGAAVGLLLSHNADPNRATTSGQTPLMLAASQGHSDLVAHLLAAGAAVATRDTLGMSAIDYARLFEKHETVEALVQAAARST